MFDVEDICNKILFLISKSEKCLKKSLQSKVFLKLFEGDEVSLFVAKEFFSWYREYKEMPSKQRIYEKHKGADIAPKLHIKFKVLADMSKSESQPTENEFDSYLDELKMAWMQEKVTENLNKYPAIDKNKAQGVNDLSKSIKEFGNQFVKLSDSVVVDDDGEYSLTTENITQNIEDIKNKDITTEKRFKIGHRVLDNETKGFRYGDLLMILGNINQGKSMVLTNIVYNLWKDNANVLLLTCEMKPHEFDERIYSRATNINYSSIINGKGYLDEADIIGLDNLIKTIKERENKIITKFLRTSDNVGTVETYLDDLRLKYGFVPDVVVVDSLEHISPLYPSVEDKDNLKVAQIITEFKDFAQTCYSGRGVVVISTHQAKSETHDKKFEEISVTDFGRSKVAAEKPDFAMYIRSLRDFNTMNVKLVKARRTTAGLCWTMAIDFSKALVADTDSNINSEMLPDD